jgi:hypothetical protein
MIGACAFAEIALEASAEDFAAKETLQTQASLGDLINITHNLRAGRIAEDGSLLDEQRAPSVCVAFAILGRQQILIVQIVRAQQTRELPRTISVEFGSFGPRPVILAFPLSATGGILRNTARRRENIGSSFELIELALVFSVVFRGALATQFALNLIHVDPDTV